MAYFYRTFDIFSSNELLRQKEKKIVHLVCRCLSVAHHCSFQILQSDFFFFSWTKMFAFLFCLTSDARSHFEFCNSMRNSIQCWIIAFLLLRWRGKQRFSTVMVEMKSVFIFLIRKTLQTYSLVFVYI